MFPCKFNAVGTTVTKIITVPSNVLTIENTVVPFIIVLFVTITITVVPVITVFRLLKLPRLLQLL